MVFGRRLDRCEGDGFRLGAFPDPLGEVFGGERLAAQQPP